MRYKIIRGEFDEVESRVNKLLKEGWELYGNPYFAPSGNMFQALIQRYT